MDLNLINESHRRERYNPLTGTWESRQIYDPLFKPLDPVYRPIPAPIYNPPPGILPEKRSSVVYNPVSTTRDVFRPDALGGPIGAQIMRPLTPPPMPRPPCFGPFG